LPTSEGEISPPTYIRGPSAETDLLLSRAQFNLQNVNNSLESNHASPPLETKTDPAESKTYESIESSHKESIDADPNHTNTSSHNMPREVNDEVEINTKKALVENYYTIPIMASKNMAILVRAGGFHVNQMNNSMSTNAIESASNQISQTSVNSALCMAIAFPSLNSDDSSTTMNIKHFDYVMPSDQWLHMALVYNDSFKKMSLLIDGTVVDEITIDTIRNSVELPTRCIGCRCCSSHYISTINPTNTKSSTLATNAHSYLNSNITWKNFNGRIGYIRAWNTVRSQSQISSNQCYNLNGKNPKLSKWNPILTNMLYALNMTMNKDSTIIYDDYQRYAGYDCQIESTIQFCQIPYEYETKTDAAMEKIMKLKDFVMEIEDKIDYNENHGNIVTPGVLKITSNETSDDSEVFNIIYRKIKVNNFPSINDEAFNTKDVEKFVPETTEVRNNNRDIQEHMVGYIDWCRRGLRSRICDGLITYDHHDSTAAKLTFTIQPEQTWKNCETDLKVTAKFPTNEILAHCTKWFGYQSNFEGLLQTSAPIPTLRTSYDGYLRIRSHNK
jgi:hypothetical protein